MLLFFVPLPQPPTPPTPSAINVSWTPVVSNEIGNAGVAPGQFIGLGTDVISGSVFSAGGPIHVTLASGQTCDGFDLSLPPNYPVLNYGTGVATMIFLSFNSSQLFPSGTITVVANKMRVAFPSQLAINGGALDLFVTFYGKV